MTKQTTRRISSATLPHGVYEDEDESVDKQNKKDILVDFGYPKDSIEYTISVKISGGFMV